MKTVILLNFVIRIQSWILIGCGVSRFAVQKVRILLIVLLFLTLISACETDGENNGLGPNTPEKPTLIKEDLCVATGEIGSDIAPMRLLTRYEFDNSVRDLFGFNANLARTTLPVENASEGFENTPENTISDLSLRKILDVAEDIGDEVSKNFELTSIDALLVRAFRRPPTREEVDTFQSFYVKEVGLGDVRSAKKALIMSILLSPQFLYRIDLEDEGAEGDLVLNDGYKIASRLSYFLWGSMPDDILLDAAKNDELGTKEEINAQVLRMLEDEKAQDLVGEFYRQWLGLNALETASKDTSSYPTFDNSLPQDYLESAMRFVKFVHFGGGGDVETLLTSDKLFLTPDLAAAIGESGDVENGISKPNERAGILTHPALMFLLSYPNQSSPIHRGIFVRERVLCQPLPAPPMNLDIRPPELDLTLTTRERFSQLTASSFCTSCHIRIDPLGFGFENYDAMGAFRSSDGGEPVNNSGELSFTRDPTLAGRYNGGIELAKRLGQAKEVQECIGENWFQFAHGRRQTEKDTCETRKLLEEFSASGGHFNDLMVSIATSDAFRYRLLQGRQ